LPVTRNGKKSIGVAINIHRGSYNSTSSAGCQTIHPDQYSDFITTVYEWMDKADQKKIPYVLVANTKENNTSRDLKTASMHRQGSKG
jgi:lysozyme